MGDLAEGDAAGGVEVAGLNRVDDGFGGQMTASDHHPAPAGRGAIDPEVVMRVVGGQAKEGSDLHF